MCIGNFGTINDECANAMEGLLWKQEPEFQHLRSNVGNFTDESKITPQATLWRITLFILWRDLTNDYDT
jgi:hypothetical protein